jgi:hypothetical protein
MGRYRSTAVVALAALVGLAVAVGAYFLFYAPALEKRGDALTKAEAAESENEATREELKDLAEQQRNLDQTKEKLAKERGRFPTSLELATFTRDLWNLAARSGAKVVSVNRSSAVALTVSQPLPPGPGDKAAPVVPQPPSGLYQYTFNIEIEGEFEQTQTFLGLLQADESRMFLVTSVSLSPGGSGFVGEPGDVGAYSIQGYTYALVPPDQIPASSTEGGNNGG